LVVTLNRPAEIFPGSEDCQTASLTVPNTDNDATPAGALPTDTTGNGVSEQVNATLSGDGITLTVSNKPLVTPLDTGDFGTSISFNGIHLRGRDAGIQRSVFRIGSAAPNASVGCNLAAAYGAPAALTNARTNTTQSNTLNLF
jgi:hypothetical protein